jgi:hypothetical protein
MPLWIVVDNQALKRGILIGRGRAFRMNVDWMGEECWSGVRSLGHGGCSLDGDDQGGGHRRGEV